MKSNLLMGVLVLLSLVLIAVTIVSAEQAAGPGFSETPTLEKIPAGPIAGEANGRPFAAQAVYFQPSFGKWCMVVSDKPLPEPTGMIFDNQAFNIDLDELPTVGGKYSHPMGYGGGYFQVQKSDKPGDTTSWNSDNAWVIEITKWEVKPYDEAGEMFQVAGAASGKIYIAYKGGMDIKNSWAAGTFTDAPIRYMGKPELEYPAK